MNAFDPMFLRSSYTVLNHLPGRYSPRRGCGRGAELAKTIAAAYGDLVVRSKTNASRASLDHDECLGKIFFRKSACVGAFYDADCTRNVAEQYGCHILAGDVWPHALGLAIDALCFS